MKKILSLLLLVSTLSTFANSECQDPNLNGIKRVDNYYQLEYLTRFTKVAEVDSAAPAGFQDTFEIEGNLCREVTATYLRHTSGTLYVVYTTGDDYCDGGNTIGIMVNMTKYSDLGTDLKDSVVGTISDSWFSCN